MPLDLEEAGHMLDREHRLQDDHDHQVSQVFAVVTLAHGGRHRPVLHVIADHRLGDGLAYQTGQGLVHHAEHLLQVQAHIGQLVVPGASKFFDCSKRVGGHGLLLLLRV